MQQWEYWDTYARYGEPGPNFGELGLLGYELVSAFWHPHMECTCFYFKKPIPQQSIATEIFNEVKNEVEGIPKSAFYEHPPCTCGTDELCRIHSV